MTPEPELLTVDEVAELRRREAPMSDLPEKATRFGPFGPTGEQETKEMLERSAKGEWKEPPFRHCPFCGCHTNARALRCCEDGSTLTGEQVDKLAYIIEHRTDGYVTKLAYNAIHGELKSLQEFEEDVRGWSRSDGRLLEHVKAACDALDERRRERAKR